MENFSFSYKKVIDLKLYGIIIQKSFCMERYNLGGDIVLIKFDGKDNILDSEPFIYDEVQFNLLYSIRECVGSRNYGICR